jgi:hypothetical protein
MHLNRKVWSGNTREEFLKNPKEYVERWTGIKASDEQIESVVDVVRQIGDTLDTGLKKPATSTKWVFTC